MVRKRDRYTRLTAKRTRPALPGPTDGWVIAELARIARVPLRTLRYYVQLNLLAPSEFRGTATRYQRRELLRLFGILRLKSEARSCARTRVDTWSSSTKSYPWPHVLFRGSALVFDTHPQILA